MTMQCAAKARSAVLLDFPGQHDGVHDEHDGFVVKGESFIQPLHVRRVQDMGILSDLLEGRANKVKFFHHGEKIGRRFIGGDKAIDKVTKI